MCYCEDQCAILRTKCAKLRTMCKTETIHRVIMFAKIYKIRQPTMILGVLSLSLSSASSEMKTRLLYRIKKCPIKSGIVTNQSVFCYVSTVAILRDS